MSFGLHNLGMLLALAALAIPILIHLLLRRRHQVVDWAAMQFLQVSKTVRRRWWLEELLLLAVRLGLIALLVLALAGPFGAGPLVSGLAEQPPRDLVLVLDGSASMGASDGRPDPPSAQARAKVQEILEQLRPGDRAALLLARQPPQWLAGELTTDRDHLLNRLAAFTASAGNSDWPAALQEARRLLAKSSQAGAGQVLLFRDQQRFGWADEEVLTRWQTLPAPDPTRNIRQEIHEFSLPAPTTGIPNAWLTPLQASRSLVWPGQKLRFASMLHLPKGLSGFPWKLQVEHNGQRVETLPPPDAESLARGRHPITFHRQFTRPGAHLVSLLLTPDPQATIPRPDWLLADNRQDLALEVVQDVPVLVVTGADKSGAQESAFFLEKALAPAPAEPGALQPRVVSWQNLRPLDLAATAGALPYRVVILADVPGLTTEMVRALEAYLEAGGGVFVVLGPRAHEGRELYDRLLERQGRGWLPVHLVQVQGTTPLAPTPARPEPRSFQHPGLSAFQQDARSPMDQVHFGRWWLVNPAPQAVTTARLSTGEPWLVERPWKKGRVLVCTTPLDRSWDSNFPAAWEYPVFAHELIAYLAGVGAAPLNLSQGQSFQWQPRAPHRWPALPARAVLRPPLGEPQPVTIPSWPWSRHNLRDPGAYALEFDQGFKGEAQRVYFTVQTDPRESDLTLCTPEENRRVARLVGLEASAVDAAAEAPSHPVDLWWLLLLGVMGFFLLEVMLTRRIASRHGALQ